MADSTQRTELNNPVLSASITLACADLLAHFQTCWSEAHSSAYGFLCARYVSVRSAVPGTAGRGDDAKLDQFALDLAVAPGRILSCQIRRLFNGLSTTPLPAQLAIPLRAARHASTGHTGVDTARAKPAEATIDTDSPPNSAISHEVTLSGRAIQTVRPRWRLLRTWVIQ